MRKFNLLSIVSLAGILTGCATDSYVIPTKTNTQQPLATVSNYSKRSGFYSWQNATINAIDNKEVDYGFWGDTSNPIPVTAGQEHSFVIMTNFNRGFADGPYNAIEAVRATLKAGIAYQVKMKVDADKIGVWIEDSSGHSVSPTEWKDYSLQAQEPAPIVIPMAR